MTSDHIEVNKSKNRLSEPEKVLADATIFRCLLKEGKHVSDIAAALPSRKMKLYTTRCTVAEIKDGQGEHELDVSKELRAAMDANCGHGDAGLSSVNCIADFMDAIKSRQFIVATNSHTLQKKLRVLLPGFLFIRFDDGVFRLNNSPEESDPRGFLKRSRDSIEKQTDIVPRKLPRSNTNKESKGPHTVFVVGFGADADADLHFVRHTLRTHFASCGQITRVFVRKNGYGGPQDIAFIDFMEKSAFNKALKLTRTEVNGDTITVEPARKKSGVRFFQDSGDDGKGDTSSCSDSETSSFDEELKADKLGYAGKREGQDKTWEIFVVGFGSNGDHISVRVALRVHFAKCGYITRMFIPEHQKYGFIHFNDETAFHKALELNRTEVNGETITVEPARGHRGRGYKA